MSRHPMDTSVFEVLTLHTKKSLLYTLLYTILYSRSLFSYQEESGLLMLL